MQRARQFFPNASQITFTIDPDAPCFQLGNAREMSARRSQSLEDMYADAGFDVTEVPYENGRKRVEKVVHLEWEENTVPKQPQDVAKRS